MEITSKKHLYKYYLTLIFVNTLFLLLISFLLEYFEHNNKSVFGSLILLIITISINVGFIKNSPSIVLSKVGITLKNKFYNWNKLSIIKLTGKGNMIFTSRECATLTFDDDTTIKIYDDFYSNIAEIKCFIQQIVIDKKDKIECFRQDIISNEIEKEIFVSYKGNPLFTFVGIYLCVLLLLLISLFFHCLTYLKRDGAIVSMILIFIMFFIFYRLMNYFEVSTNFFCVRKHYFYWKKEYYHISDIREVIIEKQGRFPNRLRFITKDFKSKLYPAVSLYDKTWLKMKKDLESKNIIVRNENIYENN